MKNQVPAGNAERIWGSRIQNDVAAATETTLVLQAAQPLWADLSRLCLSFYSTTEPAADQTSPTMFAYSPMVKVSAIKIRGAYDLIRGGSSPVISGASFSPWRSRNFFRLNGRTWASFQAGERIEIVYTGGKTFKSWASAGVPVVLKCDLGLQAVPANVLRAQGAAIMGCAATSAGLNPANSTITFSYDEAGVLDIANTVLSLVDDDSSASKAQNQPLDCIASSQILSITAVDSSELIVGDAGSGTIGVPAGMIGNPGPILARANPWAMLQAQPGSAGSSVVIKTRTFNGTGANIEGFCGAPFYPSGANQPGGVC